MQHLEKMLELIRQTYPKDGLMPINEYNLIQDLLLPFSGTQRDTYEAELCNLNSKMLKESKPYLRRKVKLESYIKSKFKSQNTLV